MRPDLARSHFPFYVALFSDKLVLPQLPLLELDPEGWRLMFEFPQARRRPRSRGNVFQGRCSPWKRRSLFTREQARHQS